ncbi:MAG: nucleoside recognition protein [Firmicutes bacterium]|nr:nucleoside recognition protein [Bacillota bacterium]
MLNYLWGAMILISIITAAFTGKMGSITNAAIASAKEAVTVCITMLGIISMWSGIMEIAEKSGLIKNLSEKMRPFLNNLFPDIPPEHKAMDYIAANVIANILGLGWASTPAGLKAMEQMQTLNEKKDTASRSMCMFMVFNMSSLQLISINLIAYRTQYNSINPSEIIGPGIFTTVISTVAGIAAVKLIENLGKKH